MRFFKEVGSNEVLSEKELDKDLTNYIEVIPNTTDGATEKHIPVVEVDGNNVKVTISSVLHPMQENHYIMWISIETDKGYKKVKLTPKNQPIANFVLDEGERVIVAYEYCNIHGLWLKKI